MKKMNIDFRKLSRIDQVKAINNTLKVYDVEYLAYLISSEKFDIYSWCPLDETNEGFEYWYNIKKEQHESGV
jgi:hypothetical protein